MSAPGAPTWRRLAYAAPAFVLALPIIPVYLHLPRLYGVSLGLGLTVTGLVLLGARLFDTVSDPRVAERPAALARLRRKPWIAIGALVAGPAMMRSVATGGVRQPSVVDLLYAGWTMISVPIWHGRGMGHRLPPRRLTGWREGSVWPAGRRRRGDGAAGGTPPGRGAVRLAWVALVAAR